MRTICLLLMFISLPVYLRSQSFPGFRSSNYQGVNGVFFNPANIADNRFKWDFNFLSGDGFAANSQHGLNFDDVFDASFNIDTLKAILLGGTGPGLMALGRMDLLGPSGMLDYNGKVSFAFTTRSRIFSNAREIDGRLVNAVIDGRPTSAEFPFGFDMNSALVHSVGWNELGFAGAKVLSGKGARHFYKAGVTVKFLSGLADTYLRMRDFNGSAGYGSRGTYITNTTGKIKLNTTDDNFVGFSVGDLFRFNGSGIGTDLGFIYEFRPSQDYSKYTDDRWANKYKFKAGIALLDFGRIRFNRSGNQVAAYDVNVTDGQQYTLARYRTRSVKDYKPYFDQSPQFTATEDNDGDYTVTLPAVVQGDADYLVRNNLYINLSGQLDLNSSDGLNVYAFNSVTLTPRYETEKNMYAITFNYNEISDFNAGFSVRIGRFFFGSGSLFTAIFDSKQADFHLGFHYGLAYPKKLWPDRDHDGIYDNIDACPLDSGLAKYLGCPIPDKDRDGIPDEEDSCVLIPGITKYHGCPIPDRDHDSINDEEDRCPDTPGTVDNGGCPEEKPKQPEQPEAREPDTLTVKFETANSKLSAFEATELLSAIKRFNARFPDAKFYIDGYTDNTGPVAVNNRLARSRAAFVAGIFREAGIDASRITVRSFGMNNPKCDNGTASGRACNRRVEIRRQELGGGK